ncbi:uncharacterized protein N7469_001706 [Penicillium citrinum]|uniref:Bromo domain-containing protein n=1 Tax=Penicillium citrinum TaxID=5077 RepID=A0A9W9PEZ1_PENCI|nr:uncharacterized protein N7469_001706 [Penicillium citrinum]KAJ5243379.1 hypothetical protein N7469_001706 [Penicillium citrinum]
MPPLSAYTPFESLLFFQSLAASNVRPASFASISALLNNNQHVRQQVAFSADRLSPEALEDLYATLLRDGIDRENGPNGKPTDSSPSSNPKKRKISSPRPENLSNTATHAVLVPELVAHLYARFKELVTKEIREDEKRYTQIKDEIDRLEKEDDKSTNIETAPLNSDELPPQSMDLDVKQETTQQEKSLKQAVPQTSQTAGSQGDGEIAGQTKPGPIQPSANATNAMMEEQYAQDKMVAPARPTGPSQPPVPPLAPRTQHPVPGTPTAPPPTAVPHPSQIAPRPNIATPLSKPGVESTPTQSSFQQWQLEPPPQSPYSAVSPTATSQVGSASAKQPQPSSQAPSRKPSKASISSNVPSTPGPAQSEIQTPVPIGHPRLSQTPNVVIPPYNDKGGSRPRLSIDTPGSSTPWKRTPRLSIPHSPTSPARPRPEDVSPISERGSSPEALDFSRPRERKTRRSQAVTGDKSTPTIKTERTSTTRRGRAISSASTQSRGRSVTSRERSPAAETGRDSRAERRSGVGASFDESTPKQRSKRKRGVSESFEEPKVDTSRYVVCTRGFHRTAAPILNDVTTHKLASIFAKPLGERDAPGYHDLIYRPQDLKTIKSAVHQGSKAVAAATEAVSTPAGDSESPAPVSGTPTKNNVLMLQKSEDLVPPKGIVNSAQLEKEFVRMFANAIMYNPVPERGFGPGFPMISDRGSRESTQSSDGEEGGIIQDSKDMFKDVEQAVTRWRAAERTADELAYKNVLSLRRGSVSDFNTDSADDGKG